MSPSAHVTADHTHHIDLGCLDIDRGRYRAIKYHDGTVVLEPFESFTASERAFLADPDLQALIDEQRRAFPTHPNL